jgi:hypothetical protein
MRTRDLPVHAHPVPRPALHDGKGMLAVSRNRHQVATVICHPFQSELRVRGSRAPRPSWDPRCISKAWGPSRSIAFPRRRGRLGPDRRNGLRPQVTADLAGVEIRPGELGGHKGLLSIRHVPFRSEALTSPNMSASPARLPLKRGQQTSLHFRPDCCQPTWPGPGMTRA